jgi:hypothetical protein
MGLNCPGRENQLKTKLSLLIVVFSLTALACNLLTIKPGADQAQPSPSSPAAAIEPTITVNIVEPTIQVTANTEPLITETDACKLFDELKACQVLGEAVIPPAPANSPGYSVCPFFTSTGKGIYVAITIGDQAKKNLLNEISQYQKGCSVSYSGGTSTATPFPPEVEALMSKQVLELYQMDIEMQVNCGGQIEPLPEFGPDAYAYLTTSGLQMGTVAIVSGDRIYSFSYADPQLNIAQMVEKAKEVVRAVFLPSPTGCPAPSSGESNQSDIPTPVSSPTWVGPTLIPGPTSIDGSPTTVP